MICLDTYRVPVTTLFSENYADLSSAWSGNLPLDWDFDWDEIRRKSSEDCQGIAKLSLDNQCLGLVRFGLYYYPGIPTFLEIEQLESHPISRGILDERLAKPVGKWLIWYAIQTALKYCKPSEEKGFVVLAAYEEALEYYRDKIGMELVNSISLGPDEEGFAFRFSLSEAKAFCEGVEREYGVPTM